MDHPPAWVKKTKTLHQICFEVTGMKMDDDNLTILCVRRGKKLILNVLDHYGQAFETSRIVLGI